jgi:uncharacterized protein (DUF433 family)
MTTTTIAIEPISVDDYLEIVGPDIIRVKGHRIGLEHIVEHYQEGYSPEQIAQDFPGVGLPAIYTIIAYYLHNQGRVDAYLVRVNARAEAAYQEWAASPPSPATLRVRALKERREQEQRP